MRHPAYRFTKWGENLYGGALQCALSNAPARILSGPYDTGKTYSCLHMMNIYAMEYPGARLTFAHKTRDQVDRVIVPTFERVLGYKPTERRRSESDKFVIKAGGDQAKYFEYDNGSQIWCNGLKDPTNLLSDYFDAGFVCQAEKLSIGDWDILSSRVTERAGTLPVAFLLGDCNPDVPNHWILQLEKEGKLELFESRHRDNPTIYDQMTGELLPEAKMRMQRLKNLTGLRYKRGYLGLWVSGEGAVFEEFKSHHHIVDNFDIPDSWGRYISIDFGFRNPHACLWWARSPDDELYCYREIYKTEMTIPRLIQKIKEHSEGEPISFVVADSAEQNGIKQLREAGYHVRQPKKDIRKQIEGIQERLRIKENGKCGLYYFRHRLAHPPDERLRERYEPLDTTEEYAYYCYNEELKGNDKDDIPIDQYNHGIDSTAYLCSVFSQRRRFGSGNQLLQGGRIVQSR